MTQATVSLRQMTPADGEAVVRLAQLSPDSGNIQISPHYHLDAYQATLALHPDTIGVVAEQEANGEVVGSAFVSFGSAFYEGIERQSATLHNLLVHPEHRRRGIATRLAHWRIECARQRIGSDGIITALIQEGNTGSFAVSESWRRETAGEAKRGAVQLRSKPPGTVSGMRVREARPSDLPIVAEGLNSFYEGYNLYPPQTAEKLTTWLEQTPFAEPLRHYYVVEDGRGTLLAGLAVVEEHRLTEMRVQHLPLSLRLLNKFVKLVPPDGRLRQLSASRIWFKPDQLLAARYLWESVRWLWRERGNTLTFAYDTRSPLSAIFRPPFWMPHTTFTYAVQGPVAVTPERLLFTG